MIGTTNEFVLFAVWLLFGLCAPAYVAIYFHDRLRSKVKAVSLSVAISAGAYLLLSYLYYLNLKST